MSGRYLDGDDHAWPITGHWCAACGLPLDEAVPAEVHPLCIPESGEGAP